MTETCVHCGGSGILNIVWSGPLSTDPREPWIDDPYVASCHACEVGLMWFEMDLDVMAAE